MGQILAIRSKEDRSYGIKTSESQIVLLSESNYAEFVANIDNGPVIYKETNIVKFDDPNFFSYISNKYAISPDSKYLLLPLQRDGDNYKNYNIFDLTSGNSQKLDINFGYNFVWIPETKIN